MTTRTGARDDEDRAGRPRPIRRQLLLNLIAFPGAGLLFLVRRLSRRGWG